MAAYITLGNWTEQGVHKVKDTVKRARAVKEAAEAAGGRAIGVWWTMGQYDVVLITEMPDDEAVSRLALATGMQGNVHTTTLRAFSEDEMEHLVDGLP